MNPIGGAIWGTGAAGGAICCIGAGGIITGCGCSGWYTGCGKGIGFGGPVPKGRAGPAGWGGGRMGLRT